MDRAVTLEQPLAPVPDPTTTAAERLARALGDPAQRQALRDALSREPAFLAEVLALIGEKHVLRRILGNPNRVLPVERHHARPPPPFHEVGFAGPGLQSWWSASRSRPCWMSAPAPAGTPGCCRRWARR
jgi:hypothetical protein